jgi:hypothetical protein
MSKRNNFTYTFGRRITMRQAIALKSSDINAFSHHKSTAEIYKSYQQHGAHPLPRILIKFSLGI